VIPLVIRAAMADPVAHGPQDGWFGLFSAQRETGNPAHNWRQPRGSIAGERSGWLKMQSPAR
jgi:hypothetical protein